MERVRPKVRSAPPPNPFVGMFPVPSQVHLYKVGLITSYTAYIGAYSGVFVLEYKITTN